MQELIPILFNSGPLYSLNPYAPLLLLSPLALPWLLSQHFNRHFYLPMHFHGYFPNNSIDPLISPCTSMATFPTISLTLLFPLALPWLLSQHFNRHFYLTLHFHSYFYLSFTFIDTSIFASQFLDKYNLKKTSYSFCSHDFSIEVTYLNIVVSCILSNI